MRTARAWVLITLAGLALTMSGCSSSSGGTAAPADAPAATSAAAAPAATADADNAGFDKRLASRLCTALSKKTAELEMAKVGPVPAEAQIVIELSNVYGDDVDQMDGAKIETMLKKTCPEVHDEALMVMKKDSFDQL